MARLATRGRYQVARHVDYLDGVLRRIARGELSGALVSMPPRHGKSTLISHYFPAWFLGRNPDKRVLFIGHEAEFASGWGRKARDVLRVWGPRLFDVSVNDASSASDRWDIFERAGGMNTAGIRSGHTGRGADLFVVDDPIKTYSEALSSRARGQAWESWQSCVETRAEPGCGFVVVGTRWHEDDLIGRLRKEIEGGRRKGWEVVSMPAIAEAPGDVLGRKEGEALWPERWPAEKLLDLKGRWDSDEARLGPYWWSALYQQEPKPRTGGIFRREWFTYYDRDFKTDLLKLDGVAAPIELKRCMKFFTIDLAVSTRTSADFFVVGVWAITRETDLVLLDLFRDRVEGPDQPGIIKSLAAKWRPMQIGIESVAYQLSLVQVLQREGLPVRPVAADKDKVSRALLASTRMSARRIWFPRSAPWLSGLEEEMLIFPAGPHDDQVDVVSMAAREASQCTIPRIE